MKKLYSSFFRISPIVFLIAVSPLIYAQSVVAPPKPHYTFKYKGFWQMYEFHPNYAKITSFNKIIIKVEGELIDKGSASLYEFEDAYDIATSDNVKLTGRSEELNRWRGVTYDELKLELEPDHGLKKGELFTFWLSYKINRLPHLHTKKPIKPGKEYHLGINIKPCAMDKNYRIVALPAGTEIQKTFHFLPIKKIITDQWVFFIYDVTKIEENVSLHIKFTLAADSPPVKIAEVEEILRGSK